MTNATYEGPLRNLDRLKETFENVFVEVEKVIVGQRQVVEEMLIGVLCGGNVLLESLPGLGKTSTISTLAKVLDLKFGRIQCTPDLMPSDITGTYIIEEEDGKKKFKFQKGPLFSNIILADEINRATPKTQSALLEAMQEHQVTVGNNTFPLEEPFFILATQNPVDQEGTYPLPEAQTDRFLLKVLVDYPKFEEEMDIVDRYASHTREPNVKVLLGKQSLLLLKNLVRQMPISNDNKKHAVEIVAKTRKFKDFIEVGASPRASIGLIMAAKAKALIDGRKFVSKEDIEKMAFPILRHRIILNFAAERDGKKPDDVIKMLFK